MDEKYLIFEAILKEKGLKPIDVSRGTGIRTSTLTDWKMGRYTPKDDKRQKIADFLGVSLAYLDGKTTKSEEAIQNHLEDKNGFPVFNIAAGQGRINDAYATEYTTEPTLGEDYSWCKVVGDSMLPELRNGDDILVHHQTETTPHDMTVIKVDGESSTVKFVEITDKGVWLRALNKDVFEDKFFSVQDVITLPVTIIGKVVEVRRKI